MSDMMGASHGAGSNPNQPTPGHMGSAQSGEDHGAQPQYAQGPMGQVPGHMPVAGEPVYPSRVQPAAPRRRGGVMAAIGALLMLIVAPVILVVGGIVSAATTVSHSSVLVQGSTITVDSSGTASLVSISDVGQPADCALLGGAEPVVLLKQGEGVFAGANIEPGNYTIECGPAENANTFSFISVNATNAVKSGLVALGAAVVTGIVGFIVMIVGIVRWWSTRTV